MLSQHYFNMPREDTIIKHQRESAKFLTYREKLDIQYQSVIKELRKQLIWWQTNAWKATFLSIYYKIKRLGVKK